MDERVIARRYARAFYKLSYARDELATAMPALRDFALLYEGDADLRALLLHPGVPASAKAELLNKAVAEDLARDFVELLLLKERIALIPLIADEAVKLYRRDEGILAAEVTTAAPPDGDFTRRLVAVLERVTGKKIELTARVDAAVIGGVRLAIGDFVIDDTLAARLKEIREAMAGATS